MAIRLIGRLTVDIQTIAATESWFGKALEAVNIGLKALMEVWLAGWVVRFLW